MKAQPYLRTSTDDKGQDPFRQMERINAWGKAERIEILPPVVDDGTSATKTSPFQRVNFLLAVKTAKAAGAKAIIVEAPDRFTRQGTKAYFVAIDKLERECDLELWTADQSRKQQNEFVGEILSTISASMAKKWAIEHSAKVKSKLDSIRCTVHAKGQRPDKTCTGKHLGRAWKSFTEEEDLMILALRRQGAGWASIAMRINEVRGALTIVTPKLRRTKGTSQGGVRRRYAQLVIEPDSDTSLATITSVPGGEALG